MIGEQIVDTAAQAGGEITGITAQCKLEGVDESLNAYAWSIKSGQGVPCVL